MEENKCYICLNTEGSLVRPCNNSLCTATVHPLCIEEQYKLLKQCGVCRSDIIKRNKFNKFRCFQYYYQCCLLILSILVCILSPLAFVILSLGKSPFNIKFCTNLELNIKEISCENEAPFSILISFVLSIPFMSYVYTTFIMDKCNNQNSMYWSVWKPLNLFTIPVIYILLCHSVGYFIIKYILDIDEFFTYKTSLAGVVLTVIILIILILGVLIRQYYLSIIDKFSDSEFGEIIKHDNHLC